MAPNSHIVYMLVYVGDLDYFLSIEVKWVPNGSLFLTQSKYIRDLLERAKMTEAKAISSPMVGGCKLSKEGADYFSDASSIAQLWVPYNMRLLQGLTFQMR